MFIVRQINDVDDDDDDEDHNDVDDDDDDDDDDVDDDDDDDDETEQSSTDRDVDRFASSRGPNKQTRLLMRHKLLHKESIPHSIHGRYNDLIERHFLWKMHIIKICIREFSM